MCCTTYCLYAVNIIVFIAGIIVIVIASVINYTGNIYGEILALRGILTVPIIILVIGVCITFFSFVGAAGAFRESKRLLYSYALIMFVLLVAALTLGMYLLLHPEALEEALESVFKPDTLRLFGKEEGVMITNLVNKMQQKGECCGVNGREDWVKLKMDVPDTCICQEEDSEECMKSCLDFIVQDVRYRKINVTAYWLELGMESPVACNCQEDYAATDEYCEIGCVKAIVANRISRGETELKYFERLGLAIPTECICRTDDFVGEEPNCPKVNGIYAYKRGCLKGITEYLRGFRTALGFAAIGLAIVMSFSMITACGVASRSRYRYR